MIEPKRKLLQDISLFSSLSSTNTITFLLERAIETQRKKGEYFFQEGDAAESLFILESGHIAVIKYWEDRQYLLAEMHAGACFGEMALMDSYPRSASIIALEDSIALEITVSTLLELCENDLADFSSLQMNLGREVSQRLRELEDRLFQFRLLSDSVAREFRGQEFIAPEA